MKLLLPRILALATCLALLQVAAAAKGKGQDVLAAPDVEAQNNGHKHHHHDKKKQHKKKRKQYCKFHFFFLFASLSLSIHAHMLLFPLGSLTHVHPQNHNRRPNRPCLRWKEYRQSHLRQPTIRPNTHVRGRSKSRIRQAVQCAV